MPNLRTIDQDGTERRSVRAVPVLRVVLVVEGTEDDDRVLHRNEHNDVREAPHVDLRQLAFRVPSGGESPALVFLQALELPYGYLEEPDRVMGRSVSAFDVRYSPLTGHFSGGC
jgi:hypothetical protein